MDTGSVSNLTSVSQRPKNYSKNYVFSLLPFIHIPSESSSSKCLRFLNQIQGNRDRKSSFHKVKDTTKNLKQSMTRFANGIDINCQSSKNNLDDIDSDDSNNESLFDENLKEKHLNKLHLQCVTSTPKSNKSPASKFGIDQVKKLYIAYSPLQSNLSNIPCNSIDDSKQESRYSIEAKKQLFYNKLESTLKGEGSEAEHMGLIEKLLTVIDKYEKDEEKKDSGAVTASTDLSNTSKEAVLGFSNLTKNKGGKRNFSAGKAITDLRNTSKMGTLKSSNLTNDKEKKNSGAAITTTDLNNTSKMNTSSNSTKRNKQTRGKKKSEFVKSRLRYKKKSRTNKVSGRAGKENRKKTVSDEQQNQVSKVSRRTDENRKTVPVSKDDVEEKPSRRFSIRLQNRVQTVRLSRYDYFMQQWSKLAKPYERPSKMKTDTKTKVSDSKRKHLSVCCDPNNTTTNSKRRRLYCSDTWLSCLEKMASL